MTATSRDFNSNTGPKPEPQPADLQAFMSAGADGNVAGIKLFLKKFGIEQVDASREGPGGYNAMMWAAKSGNMTGIGTLADNGGNVNLADRNLETPLRIAAWMNRTGAVLELLFRGADTTFKDNEGLTPAARARKHGHPELADIIDQYARGENIEALRDMKDALLAQEKREAAAKADAAIDRRTVPEWQDFSDFMGAAGQNDIPKMRKFLNQFGKQYIDTPREGEGGYSALMWASKGGAVESIAYLVANGANINLRDKNKETPLLLAAWTGKEEAVKALLMLGADYRVTDRDGLSPAERARANNHPETAEIIEQYAREQYEKSLEVFRSGKHREVSVTKASFKPKTRSKTM